MFKGSERGKRKETTQDLENEAMTKFIVMTAQASMPSSCKGRYGRVAVIETNGENMPKQIHPNHKAVKRIVKLWDRLFWG